jgi:hypothetical protein
VRRIGLDAPVETGIGDWQVELNVNEGASVTWTWRHGACVCLLVDRVVDSMYMCVCEGAARPLEADCQQWCAALCVLIIAACWVHGLWLPPVKLIIRHGGPNYQQVRKIGLHAWTSQRITVT